LAKRGKKSVSTSKPPGLDNNNPLWEVFKKATNAKVIDVIDSDDLAQSGKVAWLSNVIVVLEGRAAVHVMCIDHNAGSPRWS